jgi:prepilin-type N-terminal cleavage/methylation domain-containing protein
MFSKIKKSRNDGFTIIEVMIVLAIAALILLIVLLAVPALQRNSRNTTIKNDASSVAGGVNTFESDNNGTTPNYVGGTGKVTIGTGASACTAPGAGAASESINVNGSTVVNCGISALSTSDKVGGVVTDGTTSNIYVKFGTSCPDSGSAISAAPASARATAIYYLTEISGGNSLQCVSS